MSLRDSRLLEKWFAKLKLSLKAPRIRGFIPRSNSLIYKDDTRTGKDVVTVVLKECQGRMDDKSNLNPNQDDPILDESDWRKFAAEAASKKAAMSDIEADDIIILVMGVTGAGKTTFVNAVAGTNAEWSGKIGNNLSSCTDAVEAAMIPIPNTKSRLVLVDTPGFDDSDSTPSHILAIVADWLKETYREGKKINGIVYLHRITDIRMDNGGRTTLSIFRKMCGEGPISSHVALATSYWNDVNPEDMGTYETRELDLQKVYWDFTFDGPDRAAISRFNTTSLELARETACAMLWSLVKKSNKAVLLLQEELVDCGIRLPRTSAGKVAFTAEEAIHFQLLQLAGLLHPSPV